MEGPRSARPDELPELCRLVDTVFFDGKADEMRSRFPYFIHESNCENLLVIGDGKRLIAHAGMTQRWAVISGCSVGVACLGAVATDPAHRGTGLAGRLVSAAIEKAAHDGVDFMLVSGDRPLYRRAGAVPVGNYFQATFTQPATMASGLALRDGSAVDLETCAALYRRKPVRFVREPRDWQAYAESRYAMWNRSKLWLIERDGEAAAYLVATEPREGAAARVAEYAGDDALIAAACPVILSTMRCAALELFVASTDRTARDAISPAARTLEPCEASGTLLVVNPAQLGDRLKPWIAEHAGTSAADTFCIEHGSHGFVVSYRGAHFAVDNAADLAQTIFGGASAPPEIIDPFDEILPVPALWYGLNFV